MGYIEGLTFVQQSQKKVGEPHIFIPPPTIIYLVLQRITANGQHGRCGKAS